MSDDGPVNLQQQFEKANKTRMEAMRERYRTNADEMTRRPPEQQREAIRHELTPPGMPRRRPANEQERLAAERARQRLEKAKQDQVRKGPPDMNRQWERSR